MYTTIGSCAYINGKSGKCDNIVQNSSVRYGRNAIANHIAYLKSYGLNPIECDMYIPKTKDEKQIYSTDKQIEPTEKFISDLDKSSASVLPVDFKLQYMPESKPGMIDKNALMGASYEEMGQRYFVSISEMEKQLNPDEQGGTISVAPLDLNYDRKIDIGEYAASILLSDMLSTDKNSFSTDNINGIITSKGENSLLDKYNDKEIQYIAYSYLYNFYNLGQAAKDFAQNPNNCTYVN